MEVPANAVDVRSPGVDAVACVEEGDGAPAVAADPERVALVGAASAGVHDQTGSARPAAAAATAAVIASTGTDGDAYGT